MSSYTTVSWSRTNINILTNDIHFLLHELKDETLTFSSGEHVKLL